MVSDFSRPIFPAIESNRDLAELEMATAAIFPCTKCNSDLRIPGAEPCVRDFDQRTFFSFSATRFVEKGGIDLDSSYSVVLVSCRASRSQAIRSSRPAILQEV
jgi:hypothetical protein